MANPGVIICRAFSEGLFPDDTALDVAAWADKYRMLSSEASPEPGRWDTDRTPYLREIMQRLSSSDPCDTVVFIKSSQVGGTESGNNWMCYIVDVAPGPMLFVQPTIDMLKRLMKQRIEPMMQDTPRLAKKLSFMERDGDNTQFIKKFPGGILILTGANSETGLRSMPARYLFLDEVDAYPRDVGGKGDPVELAIVRTQNFRNRKVFMVSTPLIKGQSRIEDEFEKTDKRRFYVPCPHCGHMQYLRFKQLKWTDKKDVHYECESCEKPIYERHKTKMLRAGEWRATATPTDTKTHGYHINALYSPIGWLSWANIVKQWQAAQGNTVKLKTFVNTVLGESWVEQGDAPDYEKLYRRRSGRPMGVVPKGAYVLTCGVDIQKDRIEAAILGWGDNLECWTVDYRILKGDALQKDVWDSLRALLEEEFPHEEGFKLKIRQTCIDSNDGHTTHRVYNFVRSVGIGSVCAIRSFDSQANIIGRPRQVDTINPDTQEKIYRAVSYWPICVSMIKEELYGFLRQEPPLESTEKMPRGFIHFQDFDLDWFQQLCSEYREFKIERGKATYKWKKNRERNEVLDTFVYARAGFEMLDLERYTPDDWRSLRDDLVYGAKIRQTKNAAKVNPFTGKSSWF